MNKKRLAAAVVAFVLPLAGAGVAGAAPKGATCSNLTFLGIDVHGEHVVRDYVIGVHEHEGDFDPSGGVVGAAVSANRGADVPGGPGAGGHLQVGIAPGASFCTGSKSPGKHF